MSGGGQIGIDPRATASDSNPEQPKTLVPVFQFDLEVPAEAQLVDTLGLRVYVRFDHEPAPLALQAYRAARRLLLRHFEV